MTESKYPRIARYNHLRHKLYERERQKDRKTERNINKEGVCEITYDTSCVSVSVSLLSCEKYMKVSRRYCAPLSHSHTLTHSHTPSLFKFLSVFLSFSLVETETETETDRDRGSERHSEREKEKQTIQDKNRVK